MRYTNFFIALTLSFTLASCGGESNSAEDGMKGTDAKEKSAKESQLCTYSFAPQETSVNFTAFKFTEKVGVGGNFSSLDFEGAKESADMWNVFSDVSFAIDVHSIDTKDKGRNEKIIEHFFGTINTDTMKGKVVNIVPTDTGATCTISMVLNGVEQSFDGVLSADGDEVTLSSTIDVAKWNASSGIAQLNAVCEDLHTGTDGVSNLWSEVDLKITTLLDKECI
jgi:polyisoprenoid-binding protein YceI